MPVVSYFNQGSVGFPGAIGINGKDGMPVSVSRTLLLCFYYAFFINNCINVSFFPKGNTLKRKEKRLLLTSTSSWAGILGNLFLKRPLSFRFVRCFF